MTFHIIAYPDGARQIVGTLYASHVDIIMPQACTQARMRGEYVDVEQDGRCVAVVDGAGPVHGYESEFRYGA